MEGNDKSDLTLTNDFLRIGEGCELGTLPVDNMLVFLSRNKFDLFGVGCRLNGDPVQP